MAKAKVGVVVQPIRRTYRAEVALTRGQAVIQGTADDQVKLPGAANVPCIGIVEEDAAAGAPVSVIVGGEAVAIAGAAIAAGAYVQTAGASGKVIATAAAGQNFLGRAVHAAAADADEVVLQVMFGTV